MVGSFLLEFSRKPAVQKLALEVGIRKGGKEQSGLVWTPSKAELFVALFIGSLAACDFVIAKIISSRLKDVQTRLNWKLES